MKNIMNGLVVLVLVLMTAYAGYRAGVVETTEKMNEKNKAAAEASYSMKVEAAEGYSIYLMQIGYCREWADHKAFVEVGLIKADGYYWMIEMD